MIFQYPAGSTISADLEKNVCSVIERHALRAALLMMTSEIAMQSAPENQLQSYQTHGINVIMAKEYGLQELWAFVARKYMHEFELDVPPSALSQQQQTSTGPARWHETLCRTSERMNIKLKWFCWDIHIHTFENSWACPHMALQVPHRLFGRQPEHICWLYSKPPTVWCAKWSCALRALIFFYIKTKQGSLRTIMHPKNYLFAKTISPTMITFFRMISGRNWLPRPVARIRRPKGLGDVRQLLWAQSLGCAGELATTNGEHHSWVIRWLMVDKAGNQ